MCFLCPCISADSVFLLIMTALSCLIVYVDFQVLEKMFEEYFLLRHYLDANTYNNCYAPQAQMRMIFEGYAIYVAVLVTTLTACLAFNLSDDQIVWVAKKVINVSAIAFGPLLFTLCTYGIFHMKALSKVCGLKGIDPNDFNYVCVILVIIFMLVGLAISYYLAN
jgi:hypothetical protein